MFKKLGAKRQSNININNAEKSDGTVNIGQSVESGSDFVNMSDVGAPTGSKSKAKFFKRKTKTLDLSQSQKEKDKALESVFINMGTEINLSNSSSDDFVIVGEKSGRLRGFLSVLRVGFSIISFIALTIFAYLFISFKVIPEDVQGAAFRYGGFSAVSRNYQPNLNELKYGDKLICADGNLEFIPLISKYEILTFVSRNGAIIFAKDAKGQRQKIQSVTIDYVVRQ